MPKISKPSNKKKVTKAKKVATTTLKPIKRVKKAIVAQIKVKASIKVSKNYIPKDAEKYMCDKHISFFKIKLIITNIWHNRY